MAGRALKLRAFSVSTMACAKSAAEGGGVAGVADGHGNGGVGTGTISERELLVSSLSAFVLVASAIALTGLLYPGKNRIVVAPLSSAFAVWSTPLTLTTKLRAVA